jgi:hypothetical protein
VRHAQGARKARAIRERRSRRNAQLIGLGGFLCALALPLVLWHRPIEAIASDFRLELDYLVTGWTGYGLIILGLLFLVPVAISAGRSPTSRLYPRGRNAYAGWGVSLYVLGLILATQVAATAGATASP